jgi:hypothetical protein
MLKAEEVLVVLAHRTHIGSLGSHMFVAALGALPHAFLLAFVEVMAV